MNREEEKTNDEEMEYFSPLRLPREEREQDIFTIEESPNIKKIKNKVNETINIVTSRDRISSSPEVFGNEKKLFGSFSSPKSPNTKNPKRLSLTISTNFAKKKLFAPSPTRQDLDNFSTQRRKASVDIMKPKDILSESKM
jgi:hypothetical protein